MANITPQDTFRTLLSFLKSEPLNWFMVPLAVPSLASEEGRNRFTILKPVAIKIMESGIFFEGGLSALYSEENLPIRDLDQFIYDLAYLLFIYEKKVSGYPAEFQAELFATSLKHLEMFVSGVKRFKGKRTAQPFKTVLNKLRQLECEMQTKTESPSPFLSLPKLKRRIVDIFCEHIKGTKELLYTRIADLLKVFDIPAEPGGIKEYFKN